MRDVGTPLAPKPPATSRTAVPGLRLWGAGRNFAEPEGGVNPPKNGKTHYADFVTAKGPVTGNRGGSNSL